MNIEKRLFQIIGDEAGYVHTLDLEMIRSLQILKFG